MSSPDTPPLPPPSQSASLKQILVMFGFASLGSLFVINAIRAYPGNALWAGMGLAIFGMIFFAGMISKARPVELFACAMLTIGAGGLIAIYSRDHKPIWLFGFLFFVLCVLVILSKHRFIDQPTEAGDRPRNPYD